MTKLADIRQTFLDYFEKKGHEIVPSAPLIPQNDPTLMFVNAGMVPFKNTFTGLEPRNYKTAASSQKCVRAGGKHNDLENVGYTARHHTFFEMLGNFSFGDYFKEEAILYAWDLLTKGFEIPKEKLLVTVYAEDEEAKSIWKKVSGFSDDKIIKIATSDNFWSMGDTGPCGPCSEIFYDHGDHIPGGPPGSPDEDGDRFVEIWNLVFMQYDQKGPHERVALPAPSIDTGMGLERIAAVLQGTHNNYEVDMFQNIIATSAELTGRKAEGEDLVSHRVIADHLRSSCFLIADGVLPLNDGRGYVLRRILRRAMRHAHKLGTKDPLLYKLAPSLIHEMGDHFPELQRAKVLIEETLKNEEEKFRLTLAKGLKILRDELAGSASQTFSGNVAFKLYDTYGFPLDLTQDILRAKSIQVDLDGFDQAMSKQKEMARAAWSGSGQNKEAEIWFNLSQELPATEFLGYQLPKAQGHVLAIIKDGKMVTSASSGETVDVIVNQTPFYAESGGQVGDKGKAISERGQMTITDTQKRAQTLFVHHTTIDHGELHIDDILTLEIDLNQRREAMAHHSATHLLHAVLRNVLGSHVSQKGSYVAPDRLRFDFSNNQPVNKKDLKLIEDKVNALIRLNSHVEIEVLPQEDALKKGALALFGEKYGDEVRVISMGGYDAGKKHEYSIEFCGGTHVNSTGDIGLFKIISESSVASGIRRIEALCGRHAENFVRQQLDILEQATSAMKTNAAELVDRIHSLQNEKKSLEKKISNSLSGKQLDLATLDKDIIRTGNIGIYCKSFENIQGKDLKGLADQIRNEIGSGVIVLATQIDEKVSLVVNMTEDLIATLPVNAVDLVRKASPLIGGKGGGGRPDMAQAGGTDATGIEKIFNEIPSWIQ